MGWSKESTYEITYVFPLNNEAASTASSPSYLSSISKTVSKEKYTHATQTSCDTVLARCDIVLTRGDTHKVNKRQKQKPASNEKRASESQWPMKLSEQ